MPTNSKKSNGGKTAAAVKTTPVVKTAAVAKSKSLDVSLSDINSLDKNKQIEFLTARLTNMENLLNRVVQQLNITTGEAKINTTQKILRYFNLMNISHPELGEVPHIVCDDDDLTCKVISMNKQQLTDLCNCILSAEDGENIEFDDSEFTMTDRLCSKISDGNYGFIQ